MLQALLGERRSWAEIAVALNRSPSSVVRRARQHGLIREESTRSDTNPDVILKERQADA